MPWPNCLEPDALATMAIAPPTCPQRSSQTRRVSAGGKTAFFGLEKNGFEKINSGEKILPRQNPSKISKNPPMHGYFVDILGKLLTKNCQELTVVWSIYGGFLKWWYPQIIHFNRVSHYKPSIFGYPYYWKHPYMSIHHTIDQVFLYEWWHLGRGPPTEDAIFSHQHDGITFLVGNPYQNLYLPLLLVGG